MSKNYFGEDFDVSGVQVDESLYQEPRQQFPGIAYSTKVDEVNNKWGYWFSEAANFPDGPPDGWKEHTIGSDQVYYTHALECVVLSSRGRYVVEAGDGRRHSYPLYTPKDEKVEGSQVPHIQAMVILPGYPETPFIVGLKGWTKFWSWFNDLNNTSFNRPDFPMGAKHIMRQYAIAADKYAREELGYNGVPIPAECSYWFRFVPATEMKDGKKTAQVITMGRGSKTSKVNPFTIDVENIRYVGNDNRPYFEAKMKEWAVESGWADEWGTASEEAADRNYESQDVPVQEDDEIPF